MEWSTVTGPSLFLIGKMDGICLYLLPGDEMKFIVQQNQRLRWDVRNRAAAHRRKRRRRIKRQHHRRQEIPADRNINAAPPRAIHRPASRTTATRHKRCQIRIDTVSEHRRVETA